MESLNVLIDKKSKGIYDITKNDYFLRKLFDYLSKKKKLDIIKYNKKIQKRINIDINDFKQFSEKYSSIEIEIIPAKKKYGKFININKGYEIFYHIYFNNNNEEIKRNYLNKNETIKKIKVIIDYQVKSFENLFDCCECIESIFFKKFIRNNIHNMNGMFHLCSSLKDINLSNFNTNNVIDMNHMFYYCSSLKEINVSNFNTNNVTNMSHMFSFCSSLKELNISNFNTNNVTNMWGMFYECSSMKELNLSNLNINNETDMGCMFWGCSFPFKKKIKALYKNLKEEVFDI